MAIKIKFDLTGNPEPPTIILANRNGNMLGQLKINVDSIELVDRLNDASEISFTINKYINEELTPLWDKVVDFKLIYCKEWDAWFEINVELDEKTETVKTVMCTQLSQAELSQIMLYDIEINTEKDIERDDYKISILYDSNNPDASILNRILKDKAPHYSIVYVSPTVAKIQRSFSFNDTSILDALQEIAEEIGCLIRFYVGFGEDGKLERKIAVYDLQQYCSDCGHRGEYTDVCPKCNSTNIINGYGEDTLIFVTSDELASEGIQLVADTDSVKNCFRLEAGDDLMTATIRNCNPNGSNYIWYFSDDIKEDMTDELVKKIESYDETYKHYYNNYESILDSSLLNKYNALVDKYLIYNEDLKKISTPIKGFPSLMQAQYNTIDLALYLKSVLMPNITIVETNAEEQGLLLNVSLPSLIAVTDLDIVSKATADSSVLAMAKAIVNSSYKVTINSSQLVNNNWSGSFVITNYSDEEDTYTTGTISRTMTDWDETYIKQKIDKILSKENTDNLSITGLFENEYSDFCTELKKYALNPLNNFHDACQACIDILIDQGVADKNTWSDNAEGSDGNLYEKLYLPYYNKLQAIEAEIKVRENEIGIILGSYDVNGNFIGGLQTMIEDCRNKIQDVLDFKKYLGEDLWLEFCSYRRENTYSNDNYISDGLNNAELFKKAQEFFEVAENEIYKSAELQHSISTTLNNLLAIKKFKSLVNSFETGNWIRVQIDDQIYKLRLIEYTINFGGFENIPVEFSDVTKVKNGVTDVESILSQASSMATSYDSVKRQSSQGNDANGTINQWLISGLNSALVRIKNNENEDITLTKNGLLCRSYDEITETYSPEQFRLTHNIMAYTTDNWKTVSAALGKHDYVYYDSDKILRQDVDYGLTAKFVTAGYVNGSQIIGGEIYSQNYTPTTGTYINLNDGTFSWAGGKIKYDGKDLKLNSVNLLWEDIENANAEVTKITKDTVTSSYIKTLNLSVGNEIKMGENATISWGQVTGTSDIATKTYVSNQGYQNATQVTQITKNTITTSYINALKITAGSVAAENITGTTISGKTISGGTVSGATITGGSLNIGNGNFVVTSGGSLTAKSGTFGGSLDAASGTFKGVLSAVTGSFKNLEAGNSYFAPTYIIVDANGKGSVRIGTPDYLDWEDLTIRPTGNNIGNIGTPEHVWDTITYNKMFNVSQRELKEDISLYDTEIAYEELKHLPIYTFFYKNSPLATRNMSIGTMIDYIPTEASMVTPNDNECFNPISMVFWNIAASQTMQSKLEDLITKVNELEEKIS